MLFSPHQCHGPLARYVKLLVVHAPGMPGTFSPPPRVSDTCMHHGTCVTHVPWCMPGSLTGGFLWSRWRGKRSRHPRRMQNPQFYVSGKRSMADDDLVLGVSIPCHQHPLHLPRLGLLVSCVNFEIYVTPFTSNNWTIKFKDMIFFLKKFNTFIIVSGICYAKRFFIRNPNRKKNVHVKFHICLKSPQLLNEQRFPMKCYSGFLNRRNIYIYSIKHWNSSIIIVNGGICQTRNTMTLKLEVFSNFSVAHPSVSPIIQWGAVITRSNISWYYIQHCNDSSRRSIRRLTHKRHQISRSHGRAM